MQTSCPARRAPIHIAYANIAILSHPEEFEDIVCERSEHLILGIESSCDETAAAIVAGGRRILSSVVASQTEIHRKYGGVVPELASREHLRQIVPVVREAVEQAHVTLRDVDAVAVTHGPGLVGALLVGVTYGKVLALALGKPLIARESSRRARPCRVSRGACGGARARIAGGVPDRFRRPHDSLSREAGIARMARRGFPMRESAARATMPPARPTTRSRGCSRWGIPAGRSLTVWLRTAIAQAVRFNEPKMSGNVLRFQLQRDQDGGALPSAPQSAARARNRSATGRRLRAANEARTHLRALSSAGDSGSDRKLPARCGG